MATDVEAISVAADQEDAATVIGYGAINVKWYGAVGDGTADDTTAINNAVTAAFNAGTGGVQGSYGGATIFFPQGVYKVTSSIVVDGQNSSVRFVGAGTRATVIYGDFAGYIIDKPAAGDSQNLEYIGHLTIRNNRQNSDAWCLRIGGAQSGICEHLSIEGFNGIDAAEDAFHIEFRNSHITCQFANARSTGIGLRCSQVAIDACRFMGWERAIQAWNVGPTITNCSAENCMHGIIIGTNVAGDLSQVQSFSISTFQTERCDIGIYIRSGSAGLIAGNCITGDVGPSTTVSSASWAAGVLTVNSTVAHAQTGTFACTLESFTTSACNGDYTATVIDTDTFTVPLVADPGAITVGDGKWSAEISYGIAVQHLTDSQIGPNALSVTALNGGLDLDVPGSNQTNCVAVGMSTTWGMPPSACRSSWRYINCSGSGFDPVITYAELPGQSGIAAGTPEIGAQFTIDDGQKSGSGTAVAGDTVAGGASQKLIVAHVGSDVWKCVCALS
jgi:hypothetical protein